MVTFLLLLLNGTLIAGTYALAKLAAAHGVAPAATLAWQLLFAAPLVWLVAAARGQAPRRVDRATLRYAAIAGVLGLSAPSLLTFAALAQGVSAGLIGLIGALSPLFTYLVVLVLGLERLHALRAAGVVLGLAGVAWALGAGDRVSAASDGSALPWALAAVGAPLLLALGNVFRTRAWPSGLAPLSAASLTLALQAVLVVPLVALTGGGLRVPTPAMQPADLALAGAGLLSTFFYLGAFELQRRAGPVAVGQLGYVITAASLAIGALAFAEPIDAQTLLAVAVVLGGVTLVQRHAPAPAASPKPAPPAAARHARSCAA